MTTMTEIQTTQVYQVFILATPEQVWEAITNADFTRQYFYASEVEFTNGRRIARLFEAKFTELDPEGAAVYDANEKNFEARLNAVERTWADELGKIKGQPIVAWHTSWRYFAEYTKVNIVGFMEPKPGVPPSPAHLAGLIQTMKRTGAKVIVMEPFYDRKQADFVAAHTGAKVLILPPSVGGLKGVGDYLSVMDYDVKQLAAAL